MGMTREELEQFRKPRKLLTLAGLSKEGGRSRNALQNNLPDSGEIGAEILEWLMPVLKKYGYKK